MKTRVLPPLLVLSLLAVILPAPSARADNCLSSLDDSGTRDGGDTLFPNWNLSWVGEYDMWVYNAGTPETFKGITIVNFGTALAGADIKAVYARASCATANTGYLTLTYAGVYNRITDPGPPPASASSPAWTWAGTAADLGGCAEICLACGALLTMDVYVDIASCPNDGRTVWMGFPFNWGSSTIYGNGSVTDQLTDFPIGACNAPGYDAFPPSPDPIHYVSKEGDVQYAAPGDTVTFTIHYGRPGTSANLNGIDIFDSLPAYTHYVPGSAVPAPVPGWDPDPGPPNHLLWQFPGPLPVAGGPTGEITFQATVDWGNGESFEPGSGDVAAPEGSRLANVASGFFNGATGCDHVVSNPATTVVRRFMFWMVPDNDMLYSQSLGQPPDEVTFTAFVRNMSPSKTWWDVQIWDTVPAELNPWCVNCGFDDPCIGWTMTPSGCAAANPGDFANAARTLLTWTLDMPAGFTIELRWKAQVYATVPGGSTAVNLISLLEIGNSRVLNGTGNSTTPRNFTSQIPIILATTYISYVGYPASDNNPAPGFFLDFFPLNKKTQFEVRAIEYMGGGLATTGGVSQSIGCLIGDCINGFPGNGSCALGTNAAISGGGIAGCKVERTPATYDPTWWFNGTNTPTQPWNFLYKMTSNSPVCWQMLTHMTSVNQDRHTYAPSTNMSYAGFIQYTWPGDYSHGTNFSLMNTGMNVYHNLVPTQTTSVFLFTFNYGTLQWDFFDTRDLGPESQTTWILGNYGGTDAVAQTWAPVSPLFVPWRFLSSDTAIISDIGVYELSGLTGNCAGTDNHGALAPTRETGYCVNSGNGQSFYGICTPTGCGAGDGIVIVGNVGAATASYKMWVYTPDSTVGGFANVPTMLRDTGGSWQNSGTFSVPPGLTTACNPDIWGNVYPLNRGSSEWFKVELVSGGPIQVFCGDDIWSGWGGGSVIHPADQVPGGTAMGAEYWMHEAAGRNPRGTGCPNDVSAVDIFVPKTGAVVHGEATDSTGIAMGMFTNFTTNGPDQCVIFQMLTSAASTCTGRRNWRFTITGSDAIALYSQCTGTEKGYTAPFLQTGDHYVIVAPPVVYLGQSFWITVIVQAAGNRTKMDYCGTSSFTSTDPGAILAGQPMDSYNYTWTSNQAPCSCASNCNDGTKLFLNVTMTVLGYQTIVATDVADGSIVGIATVQVVAADIKLTKEPFLQVSASGDVVQFKICWSNYSTATGSSFTITDEVPNGTVYFPDAPSNHFCGATKGFGAATVAYSTTTNTPGAYSTLTGPPTTAVQFLKWTIPTVGVATTGCVCFKVTVQ